MKKFIQLTESEINNADISNNGQKYTVVVRPTTNGKKNVSVVWLDTMEIYDSKVVSPSGRNNSVSETVKNLLRNMDKNGQGGKMTDSSRTRNFC